MKLSSLLASTAVVSIVTISTISLQALNPQSLSASAQQMKVVAGETDQQKIDQLLAVKGKPGSAELMRKLYAKDLTPIGIQPGGAGMVVNLYSKANNTTISLCTTFDVVVAVKKGKIPKFAPAEVK
jgi:hypothetical protein